MVRWIERVMLSWVVWISAELWSRDQGEALFVVAFHHGQKFRECDFEGDEAMP